MLFRELQARGNRGEPDHRQRLDIDQLQAGFRGEGGGGLS
jgi:hypothetical protein